MDLLSDISSELAIAVLVDKKQSGKVDSKQAIELIGKVYELLQIANSEDNLKHYLIQTESLKAANH